MFYKFIWFALHFPCAWSSLRSSHMGSFHYRTSYYTCDAFAVVSTLSISFIQICGEHPTELLCSQNTLYRSCTLFTTHFTSSHVFPFYLSFSLFHCVSLAPSPAIPVGFTQLIIGRSCCRGSNSLKFSLRIYWWDHTHVEHCLPIDGDSSLQWGRQALTLW